MEPGKIKISMKKFIFILLTLAFTLLLIVCLKTVIHPFSRIEVPSTELEIPELKEKEISRLAKGLSIPTVSNPEYSKTNFQPFLTYLSFLKSAYPLVFSSFIESRVNQYGLVLHWPGKDPNLKPILFLAHYDVVPPGAESGWDQPAFSGNIAGSRIYGRGALDMKNVVHGLLDASERLLESRFQPERSVYFAFGHDEEVGGREGAVQIAKHFQSLGLEFDAVYDEGGVVAKQGSLPGINSDLAMIGVAEKGFLSARIKVKGIGGHSSMPPLESAMGKAAKIMLRLETDQMKQRIIPPMEEFLDNVGGSMNFISRVAIANLWIFKPILLGQFSKSPATNAITRTTTALTMMKGSDGTNVLSPEVEFVVNFRLLPGDTVEDVRAHIQKATFGYEVEVEEVSNTRNPSLVSSTKTHAYSHLSSTIKSLFPNTVITPYITIGGTDAFKYEIVSSNIYRFNPVVLDQEEQRSIHNQNEYISLENYRRSVFYYQKMIQNYDKH